MPNSKRILVLVNTFFFLIVAPFSYSAVGDKLIYKSAKKRPEWITKTPEEKDNYYFVGVKQNAETLSDGIKGALYNAFEQLMMTIGVVVTVKSKIMDRVIQDKEVSEIYEQLNKVGAAKIRGHRVREVYYEEYRTPDNKRYFDVYVLVRYSSKEINLERQRIEEEQKKSLQLSKEMLSEGDKFIKEGNVMEGYKKYVEVVKLLSDQPKTTIFTTAVGNIESIFSRLALELLNKEKDVIKIKFSYKIENKSIPLPDVKIKYTFEKGEGELLPSICVTDRDGVAEFKVAKIKFDKDIAKIIFYPEEEDFFLSLRDATFSDEVVERLENLFKAVKLAVGYKSTDFPQQKVGILVLEKDKIRRNSTFENLLSKQLLSYGMELSTLENINLTYTNIDDEKVYTVFPKTNVDLAIIGEINSIVQDEVYGIYSVLVNIEMKVYDLRKKKLIKVITERQTSAGLSTAQAQENALAQLSSKIIPELVDIISLK
jgi:hypothetical protein